MVWRFGRLWIERGRRCRSQPPMMGRIGCEARLRRRWLNWRVNIATPPGWWNHGGAALRLRTAGTAPGPPLRLPGLTVGKRGNAAWAGGTPGGTALAAGATGTSGEEHSSCAGWVKAR